MKIIYMRRGFDEYRGSDSSFDHNCLSVFLLDTATIPLFLSLPFLEDSIVRALAHNSEHFGLDGTSADGCHLDRFLFIDIAEAKATFHRLVYHKTPMEHVF